MKSTILDEHHETFPIVGIYLFIEFESFRVKYRYQSIRICMDQVSAFGKTKDSDAGF